MAASDNGLELEPEDELEDDWTIEQYLEAQKQAEKVAEQKEWKDCRRLKDTHLAFVDLSTNHDDIKAEHVCHGIIDRYAYITKDMIDAIVDQLPNFDKSNKDMPRDRLNLYAMKHEEEELYYFKMATKALVKACGGFDVVKDAVQSTPHALQEIVTEKFDELPLACCLAVFRRGKTVVDHDRIWELETPTTLKFRNMYRTKVLDLSKATWDLYTQYEGDSKMQAKKEEQLRDYWKGHMKSQDMLDLHLPPIGDLPSRPLANTPLAKS